jgi:hypothetical protein
MSITSSSCLDIPLGDNEIANSIITMGQSLLRPAFASVETKQVDADIEILKFPTTTARVLELNLVENTSDLQKPIRLTTQNSLNGKQVNLVSGSNISTINGLSLLSGSPINIVRSLTSINQVTYDDRGTLRLLVPEVDDSTVVEGLGIFMWINTQDEPDDDETCFTTSSGQWLLQVPSFDLINAFNSHESSYTDDWREDEHIRYSSYLLD